MAPTVDFTHGSNIILTPTTPCKSPAIPLLFTPSRSSPLSSRPQNTISGMFIPKMLPSPPSSPDFLAPKRLFKPVPIFVSREKGRETRHNLFLKKVRRGREDKIIKSRGGEDEVTSNTLLCLVISCSSQAISEPFSNKSWHRWCV